MATFFVRAIEVGSELVVGMRRIGAFLDMQEPSVVQNLDDAARQEVGCLWGGAYFLVISLLFPLWSITSLSLF